MKLMFNEDSNHFVLTRLSDKLEITEQVLRDFIYQYKDTQVTDFAMCVNCQVSSYPSKSKESYIDRYNSTEDNGIPVNYKETFAKCYYEMYQKGIDMYRIWIDALREISIRPYVSFRMNDVHCLLEETNVLKTKKISERSDLWRKAHREANGYFDRAFDYVHEEVRKDILDYIEETLQRYRPDGIEIDFTREAFLFSPGNESREQINDLMRSVKRLAEKYPDKDNKPLPINVLLCGKLRTAFDLGFDVFTWKDEGLVDSVVTISRWDTINTDCEIELLKNILGGEIKLGGGQQLLIKPSFEREFNRPVLSDTDMAFGQAYANLCGGCDFVYVYNYMDELENGLEEFADENSLRCNIWQVLRNIGDIETIKKQTRRHTLTFDDSVPYWEGIYTRLPIALSERSFATIRIRTGEISENERGYIVLGLSADLKRDEHAEIYVNCKKAEFAGRGGLDKHIVDRDGYMFEIPKNSVTGSHAVIEIRAENGLTLDYAEILVIPN